MKTYFTREVKIALAAIIAVALLFVGINFLKGVNIFKSSNTYYIKFKDIQGLTKNAAVYANGYPVGIVRDIDYNYSDNGCVVVAVELDKAMYVPVGTHAELESSLMGGIKMNLLLGPDPTRHVAQGDTIEGGVHQGALDQASNLIPVVALMLPKLDSILYNFNRLSADPALAQTLSNAAVLTENLKSTSARLDAMMQSDVPQMMAHLNSATGHIDQVAASAARADVEQTMRELQSTVSNLSRLTTQAQGMLSDLNTKVNSKNNSLGLLLNDQGVYDNLNSTIRSADSLLTDFKSRPGRYIHFSVFGKKDK